MISEMAKERYTNLLNGLYEDFPSFRTFMKDGEDTDDFFSDFLEYRRSEVSENKYDYIFIYSGMSRCVIVDDEQDFVLKIPLNKRGVRDCHCEVEYFGKAKECGLHRMFAECGFFGKYGDTEIFWAERADADEDAVTASFESLHSLQNDDGYDYEQEEIVYDVLESEWGWKMMHQFEEFCSELHINDIHTANIGSTGDRLVVIDYAGY